MNIRPRRVPALTIPALSVALMLAHPAIAQQGDAAKPQSLERAQKAADAVFHWIKLNADKGASRQTATPPPPPPAPRKPAPVAAAPRPAAATATAEAPAPAPSPITERVVQAATPTPAPTSAPAPAVEREPVLLASAAPTPTPDAPLPVAARVAEPAPAPVEAAEVPLQLLVKVEPHIPRQLQTRSFDKGYAQVQFTVQPDGSVSQAQTIKASNSRLGSAAIEAIKQWRFAPIPTAREAAVEVAFNNSED